VLVSTIGMTADAPKEAHGSAISANINSAAVAALHKGRMKRDTRNRVLKYFIRQPPKKIVKFKLLVGSPC